MLFGVLRPGDELLSITGKPYDTIGDSNRLSGGSYGYHLKALRCELTRRRS
jgi:cystathionine beta-lyase family protein involved in aluminum resistance